MTCNPVEEVHLWEGSSTGDASREDFMAVMCLEIKMGESKKNLKSLNVVDIHYFGTHSKM